MTTTTRFVDVNGNLALTGEYTITDTRVVVTTVTRHGGLVVDGQTATIVHTVEPVVDAEVDAPSKSDTAPCVHCGDGPARHGDRQACVRAGYWGNRYTPAETAEDWKARSEVLDEALAEIRTAFNACFTPDMAGVDWRDDAAIQALARTCHPILTRTAPATEEASR